MKKKYRWVGTILAFLLSLDLVSAGIHMSFKTYRMLSGTYNGVELFQGVAASLFFLVIGCAAAL